MESTFSLRIDREFCYRAYISKTGEVLECDNFKSLYRCARKSLRIECGRTDDIHFDYGTADFSFGYRVDRYDRPGHCYSEWTSLIDLGYLYVSTLSEAYYPGDNKCSWMDNSRRKEADHEEED